MRASYVDRMLAQIDGVVAPIWITQLVVSDAPPAVAALRDGLTKLVAETPRLQLCWDAAHDAWRGAGPRAVTVAEFACAPEREHINRLLAARIDLAIELPLRVTLAPLVEGGTLIAIQLHHAIGDARSLMFLNRRLWQLMNGRGGEPLDAAHFSDRRALAAIARRFPAIPAIARARHRVLARRGTALRRSGNEIGAPMLRTLRVPLGDTPPAEQFFTALLAGIARHGVQDREAPLRFRIPVDLRRELQLGRTVENPCSAVPIEVTAEATGAVVVDALARALAAGVHWATLLECVTIGRLASVAQLRKHTRPELLAARRGSTLVTTYVGTIDRYLVDVPFPIRSFRTHTPTWGANAYTHAGSLVINMGAFEGLWRPDELDAFVGAMRDAIGGAIS
ncbi:MAG: hypothetical protein ABI867_30460 [Kofleriaceae bacterium]